MVTVQDVIDYVGGDSNTDDAFAQTCLDEATALVTAFVGTKVIPQTLLDLATKAVASDLFNRRNAPNGIAQFATFDGAAPVRIARDPMAAAYPILRRAMVIL